MPSFVLVTVSIVITVLTIVYMFFWSIGGRLGYVVKGLAVKNYPCKVLYTFGLEVIARTKYSYQSLYDRKMLRNFRVLYGRKHAALYQQIHMARKLSVSVMVFILLLLLAVALNAWIALLFAFAGAAGMAYYYDKDVAQRVEKRRQEIRRDFPEAITSITLLVNAGLILDRAWKVTAKSGDGLLYREMRRSSELTKNGVSQFEAWTEFSERCGEPYVDKVISALLQNLSKGNRELVAFLKRMSDESWNEHKHAVRQKGETASTRMLLPIMLTFVGILVMVMLPIML